MGFISFEGYEPKHLSHSTVDSYRMCGKKMFLQKIAQVEQRPGLAGIGGNAVHEATEVVDHLIWDQGWEALEPQEEQPPF